MERLWGVEVINHAAEEEEKKEEEEEDGACLVSLFSPGMPLYVAYVFCAVPRCSIGRLAQPQRNCSGDAVQIQYGCRGGVVLTSLPAHQRFTDTLPNFFQKWCTRTYTHEKPLTIILGNSFNGIYRMSTKQSMSVWIFKKKKKLCHFIHKQTINPSIKM